jgi:hypothetical protein
MVTMLRKLCISSFWTSMTTTWTQERLPKNLTTVVVSFWTPVKNLTTVDVAGYKILRQKRSGWHGRGVILSGSEESYNDGRSRMVVLSFWAVAKNLTTVDMAGFKVLRQKRSGWHGRDVILSGSEESYNDGRGRMVVVSFWTSVKNLILWNLNSTRKLKIAWNCWIDRKGLI